MSELKSFLIAGKRAPKNYHSNLIFALYTMFRTCSSQSLEVFKLAKYRRAFNESRLPIGRPINICGNELNSVAILLIEL